MRLRIFTFAILAMTMVSFAQAQTITNFDTTGVTTIDGLGDPDNNVFIIETGTTNTLFTGVGWDVGITPIDASWYSEANFGVGATGATATVTVAPGTADGFAGDGILVNYDSAGIIDLVGIGLDFTIFDSNGDGSTDFQLEFFESFDDTDGIAEATFSNGTAGTNASGFGGLDFRTEAVPEPASFAALGLVGFGLLRRRR